MKITYFVSKMEPKIIKNKKNKKNRYYEVITKVFRRYYESIYKKKYFIKKDTKGIIYIQYINYMLIQATDYFNNICDKCFSNVQNKTEPTNKKDTSKNKALTDDQQQYVPKISESHLLLQNNYN